MKKYLVTEDLLNRIWQCTGKGINEIIGADIPWNDSIDLTPTQLPPNAKVLTREDLERIYFDAQRTDIYTQIEKEFGKES